MSKILTKKIKYYKNVDKQFWVIVLYKIALIAMSKMN